MADRRYLYGVQAPTEIDETLRELVRIFIADDAPALLSMVSTTISPRKQFSRGAIYNLLKDRLPTDTDPLRIHLLAAYFGAGKCFDFLLPNSITLPGTGRVVFSDQAELLTFAYAGGNLHIITLCHQICDIKPDLIYVAFLFGRLDAFLHLVAHLRDPYFLPAISNIESIVIEQLWPLDARYPVVFLCYSRNWAPFFKIAPFNVVLATGPFWSLPRLDIARIDGLLCSWAGIRTRFVDYVRDFPAIRPFIWGERASLPFRAKWWPLLQDDRTLDFLIDNFSEALLKKWDDAKWTTVYHYAVCEAGAKMIPRLLYVDDLDPNLPNGAGETPIILAIKQGASDAVKALLIHPLLDLSLRRDQRAESALAAAIAADLDCDGFWEHPTLDFAEISNGALTVKLLVTNHRIGLFQKLFSADAILKGRDVNTLDREGRGLLHYAVEAGDVEFITRVLNHVSFKVFPREEIGKSVALLKAKSVAVKNLIAERFKRVKGWG
jgi:hypothetical protein